MLKRIVCSLTVLLFVLTTFLMGYPKQEVMAAEAALVTTELRTNNDEIVTDNTEIVLNDMQVAMASAVEEVLQISSEIEQQAMEEELQKQIEEESKRSTDLSNQELELMLKVVSAEARGESYEAQYTVACVILNRMESEIFPNNLEAVVMQRGQFQCVSNGAIYGVPITESVEEACRQALKDNQIENDVLWFRNSYYHRGVDKAFQIGKLYFSQQKE